jgi:hypothetical protein
MLLKGPRSHTSNNAQTTSFLVVLYVTEGVSLPYFQFYSVLLIHEWYYVHVTEGALLSYSSNAQTTSF